MAAVARHIALQRPAESVQAAGARLYADLHADIITGRLRPGASLSETRVAEHYGISRTPVREVFRRLAEDGFLRVVPQVATYVAPINLAAVSDRRWSAGRSAYRRKERVHAISARSARSCGLKSRRSPPATGPASSPPTRRCIER
jgi:DNA-binding FadR family transcriptional regulator